MAVPSNAQYRNGVLPVTGDQYNTFLQGSPSVASLRTFVGLANMQVSLLGLTTAGDGGAGTFWWNPSNTAPDDGINVIVPPAAASGAWNRLPTTAIFSSGDFSGPPTLPGYPLGDPTILAYSVLQVTSQTVQPVVNEYMASLNFISTTGANSTVATSSNKVGLYVAIDAKPGSGNVWAFNPVTVIYPGACAIGGVQTVESDLVNNSGVDYNTNIDTPGAFNQPSAFNLSLTHAGTNSSSAAIWISGTSTSQGGGWAAGVVFSNGSTNRASILDINSPEYSYKIIGGPAYGFDTSLASIANQALRLGNGQTIGWRNHAGSTDVRVLQTDASDNLYLGDSNVTMLYVEAPVTMVKAVGFDGNIGFFSTAPTTKPTVVGSKGGNAALASLLTALAGFGLLTDSST